MPQASLLLLLDMDVSCKHVFHLSYRLLVRQEGPEQSAVPGSDVGMTCSPVRFP